MPVDCVKIRRTDQLGGQLMQRDGQIIFMVSTTDASETLAFLWRQGVAAATIDLCSRHGATLLEVLAPAQLSARGGIDIGTRLARRPETRALAVCALRRTRAAPLDARCERCDLARWAQPLHAQRTAA